VMIVDDHPVFAELLGLALNAEPDLEWVGHASTSAQALELLDDLVPDVVVMDLQLGSGATEGIDLTAAVLRRRPAARVVVLTALKDHQLAVAAAAAGAVGFMQKDGALTAVIEALRAAHLGFLLIPPDLLSAMSRLSPSVGGRPAGLTARELEVLALMGDGLTSQVIAERLGLSAGTARTHVQRVIVKLGAHTRLEAVVNAARLGLLGEVDRG
jgi:DNA-binding NarL/FixJ family response regulator